MNPNRYETLSKYANSGLYLMEPGVLQYIPSGESSFKNILHGLVETERFYAFPFEGLYFNVGTLEILERARKFSEELEKF